MQNEKIGVLLNAKPLEIIGNQFVTGLEYKYLTIYERRKFELDCIFVEVGFIPNNQFAKDLVEINQYGEIVGHFLNGRTNLKGIWAAGDVTSLPYEQNNIAMGDAVRATLNINICDYN